MQRLAKKRRQGVTKEKEKDSKAGTGVCGGSKKEKETSWKQNKNNADFDDVSTWKTKLILLNSQTSDQTHKRCEKKSKERDI